MTSHDDYREHHPEVQRCLDILAEHYDTVQIFCTWYESNTGDTKATTRGIGNWFARQAHVREFLTESNESTRITVRKENEDEE